MANWAATLTTGVAFTVALFTAGPAPAAQDEPTAVILYVDNYARVPPTLLARAQTEATRIYAAAGVQTMWIDGDHGAVPSAFSVQAASRAGMPHLRVLLLCREKSERKISLDHVPPNVLGQAAHAAGRAYIFIGRVMEQGSRHRRDPALLLGRVLAHEIGHLLLPVPGHSEGGIMRAHLEIPWRAADAFTSVEGQEIRLALNARR